MSFNISSGHSIRIANLTFGGCPVDMGASW